MMRTVLALIATFFIAGCSGLQLAQPAPAGQQNPVVNVKDNPNDPDNPIVEVDPNTAGQIVGVVTGDPAAASAWTALITTILGAGLLIYKDSRANKAKDAAFDEGVKRGATGEVTPS